MCRRAPRGATQDSNRVRIGFGPDADAKALRHGHGWYFTGDTGYVDAAVTCHIGDDLALLADRGGFVQSSGAELDDSDALVDPRLAGRAWLRRGLA
jgi:hypothetical protein